MIKMGKIDFTDWLTKCTLVSTSDCILHRHTDWMTNHQEGKDLIYWCLGKKLSSGPPDSAVLSRHSGSKTGPGLKGGPIRRGPVKGGPVRRGPVGRSAVRTGPSLRGPQLEDLKCYADIAAYRLCFENSNSSFHLHEIMPHYEHGWVKIRGV